MKTNQIILGDCQKILPQIESKSIDFIFTDPPFGINFQSNRRQEKYNHLINDNNLDWVFPVFKELFRVLKDNSICITYYGYYHADIFVKAFKDVGFVIKSHIVFIKSNIGLGWHTRGQHDTAYFLCKGSPPKPTNAISDVIDTKITGNRLHPTQKDLGSSMKIIEAFTKKRDLVLDPFAGGGTILLACSLLGRNYIGIELEKDYYNKACKRLKNNMLLLP